MIICKNRKCGFLARAPRYYKLTKKAFRIAGIQHRSEKCPKCEKYDLYDKRVISLSIDRLVALGFMHLAIRLKGETKSFSFSYFNSCD
jgi:hypothetical protein